MPREFDVFMSLAGPDRPAVRRLVQALRDAGLTVFLDEDDIREYHGITAEIDEALRGSKALLAYYSWHYTSRTACQYELTATFLAGQREGNPTGRIMVINPHEETDHLLPVEFAEDKFDRLPVPRGTSLAGVVARVTAKVHGLSGRIGDAWPGSFSRSGSEPDRPRWLARRVPGTYEFVGRYADLWRLHSALHKHRFGLTQYVSSGPVAVLVGLPGIGKSALAAAYAWHFGAAHLGGVHWLSLAGSGDTPAEVRAHFTDGLRTILRLTGGDATAESAERVIGRFAEHVAGRPEPSLLVIDDVPGDLTDDLVNDLVVPAGSRLHTVLVTNRAALDGPARPIGVGPMPPADAVAMLRGYREGPDAEVEALARRLDGHPAALVLAGKRLRDGTGPRPYADLFARIDRDGSLLDPVTELLRERIEALDDPSRQALAVTTVCSPAAVPTVLLARILGAADAETAVAGLRNHLLAERLDDTWQVHALVRDAARRFVPPPDPLALSRRVAEVVADVDDAALVPHAAHLSARADLPPALADALLRRVVRHYDLRGEAILSRPHHVRLAERHRADPAVLAAAARCLLTTGAAEQAHDHARRALALTADRTLRVQCGQLVAESLDVLGDHAGADPVWAGLTSGPGAVPVELDLAYARALRTRGQHMHARRRLAALLARLRDDGTTFHTVRAAQLELARAEMETDDQAGARRRAFAVLAAYTERGLAGHTNALEAARLYAEARLALSFWELRTDPMTWQEAVDELRLLRDEFARTYGHRNVLTLNLVVAYAEALIAVGRPGSARRAVEAVRDDLLDRLGERHPVHLRALMVLGYAAGQCGRDDASRDHFARAYEGQRHVLGETHPHTLRSRFELAVVLRMAGDTATANRHLAELRRIAPASVGWQTDLTGQTMVASVLSLLPTAIWRAVAPRPKPPEDC